MNFSLKQLIISKSVRFRPGGSYINLSPMIYSLHLIDMNHFMFEESFLIWQKLLTKYGTTVKLQTKKPWYFWRFDLRSWYLR